MEISGLTLLLSATVFIATILLAIICLDCRNKSPLASISQTPASDEYVTSGFSVIHPCHPRPEPNAIHSPSNLMPHPNSADRGSERRLRPYTPTETESNPSYENQVPGTDFPDSDAEDNGYIKVLPETEPSRASTPSSDNHYVNVEEAKPDSDSDSDPDYLNVDKIHQPCSTPDLSSQSEDDDNYVNQPPMIPSA
ncbi:linker for activation of T-cells family member 1-like isoform X2 [Girardinichthys multiradiatus]|uniref:linker for activation of T-cells family member 1-like isoform X2 n=1 Tax=Girardinichthys multiradiatus TaxID=208333 RepID=UPI001FACF1A6|nr:linker for activation of T-cells family member 1-like isoform X2 [Girardinichthys multiradiatus]XP_047214829.1 linker for activation of T-cells family member 1-like isoform X2 [Girardinichthys multiradiatus]